MQTSEDNLTTVLIIGTLVVVLLITFLFLFVIIYQRRMIKNQEERRNLQIDKQNDLLRAILETQESERKRLAEDLHDSVGQVLSAIKLNLHRLDKTCAADEQAVPLLSNTRKLIDECIVEIRSIIQNVRPPLLTDFGLVEALNDLCIKIQRNTGIEVNFKHETEQKRFSAEIEVTLYRIVQELFGNSIKHAHASFIGLNLTVKNNQLLLTYRDDGAGFNLQEIKNGSGLKNMQSRTDFIKGKIELITNPGQGMQAEIKVNLVA
ncbi:sensor histidine kinase [Mucilaginibacter arboris]|uniref:Sensor histidine kinase n=1 Tax=Mucilaginibacter arboris TaxID=2682090 RepID=A0A7K1STR4_9SPHI|nr:sensor histidine kinase [Mucilaginibacter arboris]MVN20653.1 sensor histidine kinase [Mucilaginibacter arboris]